MLAKEKNAVFISYFEDRTTDIHYIKIFLSQLSHIISKNFDNRENLLFNFIFSDFLSLGYIAEFERILISNSKKGNFFLIDVDSFSNAERLYGENFSEYLISACQGIIVMPTNEIQTLNKINKLYDLLACDKKKCVSPYYLQTDTVLAIIQPNNPEVIQVNILESENEYVKPKISHEVYQIEEFDIIEIIKERKKRRLLKLMNQDDVYNPVNRDGIFLPENLKENEDELMRIINREIEEEKLIQNLNKIVNK